MSYQPRALDLSDSAPLEAVVERRGAGDGHGALVGRQLNGKARVGWVDRGRDASQFPVRMRSFEARQPHDPLARLEAAARGIDALSDIRAHGLPMMILDPAAHLYNVYICIYG